MSYQLPAPSAKGRPSRYELLLKIASGGTATVYVARRRDLARLVAVKRAHPHLLEDEAGRRALLEEARIASRMRHANVTSVHDVEETADDLFLVMDYIEGASLSELVEASRSKRWSLPAPAALRIALDVCAGLRAVHELVGDDGRPLGTVHRDISPQNVLVGLDGTSRLTDFGLARLAPSLESSRTTGVLQGKLAYVAPEVLEGARCDVQSEIFSLAVVIWESLAGRRLFRAATEAETLRRLLVDPAPRLSEVAPDVGRALDELLARALEKDPARRQSSVRVFAQSLEDAARDAGLIGTSSDVTDAVDVLVGDKLERRRALLSTTLAVADAAGDADPDHGETASMNDPSAVAVELASSDVMPATVTLGPVPFTPALLYGAHAQRPANESTTFADVPVITAVVPRPAHVVSDSAVPAQTSHAAPKTAPRWDVVLAALGGALFVLAVVFVWLALQSDDAAPIAAAVPSTPSVASANAPSLDVSAEPQAIPLSDLPTTISEPDTLGAAIDLNDLPSTTTDIDTPRRAPVAAPKPTAHEPETSPPPNPYKRKR